MNMHRIVEAKKMLEHTDQSSSDIATACGFNSQTYFANCFKRYVGMTTTEYKQNLKGK